MDRVIALLAALVALVALAVAVMVATNADLERRKLATEIAQLKTSMTLANQLTLGAITNSPGVPATPDAQASTTIATLEARIATLEERAASQAIARAASPAVPDNSVEASSAAVSSAPDPGIAMLSPSQLPSQGANPAALNSAGPTDDCIPLGTRFMAKAGDDFPICKTKIVIKVAGVSDSEVVLQGAGSIAAGAAVPLATPGCQAMVMSADVASGYAELRITCQ